jgi:hypothetical protein
MKEPLERTKLNKKYFMSLKESLFISSNCFYFFIGGSGKPIFADTVWPLSIRGLQWQLIVDRGAA